MCIHSHIHISRHTCMHTCMNMPCTQACAFRRVFAKHVQTCMYSHSTYTRVQCVYLFVQCYVSVYDKHIRLTTKAWMRLRKQPCSSKHARRASCHALMFASTGTYDICRQSGSLSQHGFDVIPSRRRAPNFRYCLLPTQHSQVQMLGSQAWKAWILTSDVGNVVEYVWRFILFSPCTQANSVIYLVAWQAYPSAMMRNQLRPALGQVSTPLYVLTCMYVYVVVYVCGSLYVLTCMYVYVCMYVCVYVCMAGTQYHLRKEDGIH